VGIRLASEADAEAALAIYAPLVRSTAISFETQPPSAAEMRRRIRLSQDVLPWLVLEREGRVDGYACAAPHRSRAAYRWSVEVSAYVRDGTRRRGTGRALYTSLMAVLALQGYRNACAGITLPNPASVAFHESLGFRSVGAYLKIGYKLGSWHDVGWWQRALGPHDAEPAEPRVLASLSDSTRLHAALEAGERT
jgi:phosphinothricin acetyltransferase